MRLFEPTAGSPSETGPSSWRPNRPLASPAVLKGLEDQLLPARVEPESATTVDIDTAVARRRLIGGLRHEHVPPLRAAVDLGALSVAVLLTLAWARDAHVGTDTGAALLAFPFLALTTMYVRGLYRPRLRLKVLDELLTVAGTLSIAAMVEIALMLATNSDEPAAAPLSVRAWLLALVLVPSGRAVVATLQRRRRARPMAGRPALIVGAGRVGTHVARRLLAEPGYGLWPVGFLDGDPPDRGPEATSLAPLLGSPDELDAVARRTGARAVILAFTSESDQRRVPVVRACQSLGLDLLVVPRFFDAFNQRTTLEYLGGLPLLSLRAADPKGLEFKLKHAADRVAAGLALVVLSPLLAALAVGVKLSSPGPLLFRQLRVGRDCQPFDLLKFRSMRAQQDGDVFRPARGIAPGGVEGRDRRTRIGRFMRRTSLDELPQLINVLRGEMSLIGPRPERPEFVELFEREIERYGERHRVRAGITGWAQVNGLRGQTSIADRAEWDNYYIENWSLRLDLIVLALTAKALIARSED
jgi:exopolysaccharide biosynthesis polyprenyl glycosylphosphotransferase